MIHMQAKINHGLEGCESIFHVSNMSTLYYFVSSMSSDVNTYVLGHNPKNVMEAAHFAPKFQIFHSWEPKCSYGFHQV